MMRFTPLSPDGLLLAEPQLFADDRGSFMESYNQAELDAAVGRPVRFVQQNQSYSVRHVLRGLHYQIGDAAQGKLVRAISGAVYDVAVDLRAGSKTCGRYHGLELSAENRRQFWIPPGFAHGFLVLSDNATLLYSATTYWNKAAERSIRWDDPRLNIAWPLQGAPVLSAKDAVADFFDQAVLFG